MNRITADTNTLISAVIARGNEFELLRLAKECRFKLVLSPQILSEFMGVISRQKFGFSNDQMDNALKQIVNICELVMPSILTHVIKNDPADNMILECAIDGKADHIVSGDEHLLSLRKFKDIKVVRTAEALKLLKAYDE